MEILITGGCGFIGCNFVRYLLNRREDARVINLDKLTYAGNLISLEDIQKAFPDRYQFIKGDIAERETVLRIFQEHEIDWVVHFAAESHVDRSILGPGIFIKTNVLGTFNLIESARRTWPKGAGNRLKGKRFLHISTDEVFGSLGETGLFTELTPYDPSSPYSASKAASNHLVMSYFRTYAFPAIISNCSNNYGPYQFPEKLIPLMIRNAFMGIELPVYGKGENVRDWIYVEDHCKALLTVLEKGLPGESYNIGGHCEKMNIRIVECICDELDKRLGPLNGRSRRELIKFVTDRPGHDFRYAVDISKIKSELGWEPEVTFEKGIQLTIDWYMENTEWVETILDGSYMLYYDRQYGKRSHASD